MFEHHFHNLYLSTFYLINANFIETSCIFINIDTVKSIPSMNKLKILHNIILCKFTFASYVSSTGKALSEVTASSFPKSLVCVQTETLKTEFLVSLLLKWISERSVFYVSERPTHIEKKEI